MLFCGQQQAVTVPDFFFTVQLHEYKEICLSEEADEQTCLGKK
jgi:hypothetical protein